MDKKIRKKWQKKLKERSDKASELEDEEEERIQNVELTAGIVQQLDKLKDDVMNSKDGFIKQDYTQSTELTDNWLQQLSAWSKIFSDEVLGLLRAVEVFQMKPMDTENEAGGKVLTELAMREEISRIVSDKMKALNRLSASFAHNLTKAVRAEEGPDWDEFKDQRDFLIKQHKKEMEHHRAAAQLEMQDRERRLRAQHKKEVEELKDQHLFDQTELEQEGLTAREAFQRELQDKYEGMISEVEKKLEKAMKRLEEGDFDLRKDIIQLEEQLAKTEETKKEAIENALSAQNEAEKSRADYAAIKRDIQSMKTEVEEFRKSARKANNLKERAERREKKLMSDVQKARDETYALDKQVRDLTTELEKLQQHSEKQKEVLVEMEFKNREIPKLKADLDRAQRSEKEALEAKAKEYRRSWLLENKIDELEEYKAKLQGILMRLGAENKKQKEGLEISEMALRGLDKEIEIKRQELTNDVVSDYVKERLQQRCVQLREQAETEPTSGPRLQLGTNSTSLAPSAYRQRILARVAALELELQEMHELHGQPVPEVLDLSRELDSLEIIGEPDAEDLPIQITPYGLGGAARSRQSVREIIQDVNYAKGLASRPSKKTQAFNHNEQDQLKPSQTSTRPASALGTTSRGREVDSDQQLSKDTGDPISMPHESQKTRMARPATALGASSSTEIASAAGRHESLAAKANQWMTQYKREEKWEKRDSARMAPTSIRPRSAMGPNPNENNTKAQNRPESAQSQRTTHVPHRRPESAQIRPKFSHDGSNSATRRPESASSLSPTRENLISYQFPSKKVQTVTRSSGSKVDRTDEPTADPALIVPQPHDPGSSGKGRVEAIDRMISGYLKESSSHLRTALEQNQEPSQKVLGQATIAFQP